jgi:hypothetical protein
VIDAFELGIEPHVEVDDGDTLELIGLTARMVQGVNIKVLCGVGVGGVGWMALAVESYVKVDDGDTLEFVRLKRGKGGVIGEGESQARQLRRTPRCVRWQGWGRRGG